MTDAQITERFDRLESMIAELRGRPSAPFKDVMNTNEIASYLGVTPGHIRRMVSTGEIPCYKSENSNRNFFRRAEIDDWRAQNRQKTNQELHTEAATRSAVGRK